ncbi:hypothetical protein BDA99DRAFT_597457 [Phascolomyces articulosus]|uniref:Uncharacterized protein n=1 Tax=Phascolomyces articulosus TaxID=60185 RepID=A0AAD5JJZ3_9FUNG|nr:hypothetical protein BDA99DRAFT_597457 [Phascolomyces articulosus]
MNTENPFPLSETGNARINPLSQYLRDTYQDIVTIEGHRFDFGLTAGAENNLLIINKMRIAMRVYCDQFPNIPNYDLRVRNMIRTHFNNKRSVLKREAGKKAIIDRRNRRTSRIKNKLDRRTRALRENRSSLEERYPSNGMDLLITRKYMSEEDSDDEEPKEKPWIVSRPEYRSIANKFLAELDRLADESAIRRQHSTQKVAREVVTVEQPVPSELPVWMKRE